MQFDRISINPNVMLGKPCIKGTRITVEFILKTLAEGADFNYILQGYPHISREDINQALLCKGHSVTSRCR